MYELIQHGEIKFPVSNPLSDSAEDLIGKLLNRDPYERLGVNGAEEIKSHDFFQNLDWAAMMRKEVPPAFRPNVTSEISVENFDAEFTSEDITQSVVPKSNLELVKQNAEQFADF
jgi:hypothetical protein